MKFQVSGFRFQVSNLSSVLGILVLFLSAGCSSMPKTPVPFTELQMKSFYQNSRPPELFGVTAYTSDEGPVFAGGNRMHDGHKALVDFASAKKSTAPIVELHVGGPGALNALIDTSSKDSWLDTFACQQSNLVPLGPRPFSSRPVTVDDPFGGFLCVVPKIKIDELNMENALMYARNAFGPLGEPARGEKKNPPDAVMGMIMLQAFSFVQIDFPGRKLFFAATAEFHPQADKLIASVPMKFVKGALACDGAVEGQPAEVLIDTGGDFELAMIDAPQRALRQVSAGDLVFVQVQPSDSVAFHLGMTDHARIGRKLLSRFKVTLDFKNKVIVFEKPGP